MVGGHQVSSCKAARTEVELHYVEQEPPFVTGPAMEAINIHYKYLHAMA